MGNSLSPGDLTNVFQTLRIPLRRFIVSAFPRLADDAEDILHNVWLEAYKKATEEGFIPKGGWEKWLWMLTRSRAIDCLRSIERSIFIGWGKSRDESEHSSNFNEPADGGSSPSEHVLERERRYRQGLLLSEVLNEFCRWCEKKPQRLAIKEAYERALHGQNAGEIAQAMGAHPDSVYQWLHQAREWIRTRLGQKDVDRSVFLTLYGGDWS